MKLARILSFPYIGYEKFRQEAFNDRRLPKAELFRCLLWQKLLVTFKYSGFWNKERTCKKCILACH